MPIYCFKCECGKEREILLSYKDEVEIKCECGKVMQRVMVQSIGIRFKGSGFYSNDSKETL